ncbi:MAG: hypothetical protein GX591_18815, partial [Planctomycetes bacterium]|nr:hypothetical protein [Planctomycetota bacterium]
MANRWCVVSILAAVVFLGGPVLAAQIAPVTVDSFSGHLGTTWDAPKSIDGDISTFWYSGLAAPAWIIYAFDDVYLVGDVSITMNDGNYRKLAKAAVSVSTDGTTFAPVGEFDVNTANASITTFNLGAVEARYVRLDATLAFYSNWDPDYHTFETAPDGKFAVSFSEIAFFTALDYADAGDDQTAYDTDGSGDEPVTLDGSRSDYPDGTITAYRWTLDGAEIATGVNPTVTLPVGVHTVMLTITCSDATTYAGTVEITVEAQPQSFAAAGDDIVVTDADQSGSETVTLDGTASGWNVVVWEWYEGQTLLGAGPTLDVSFPIGTHAVTLHCTSGVGTTDSDEVVVTVLDGAPKAPVADAGLDRSIENRAGGAGEPVQLSGTGSVDYDGTIVSYAWSENGTPIATGATPTVVLAVGTHVITLTVTDDDAMTGTDTVTITVVPYVPGANDAPRVGGWEADSLFPTITAADMEVIRSKKILLASRSFGQNLRAGMVQLEGQNAMYHLNYTGGFQVISEGIGAVPDDIFQTYDFVQYYCTYWPHTARVTEFDSIIRQKFHDDVDAAIIFFHYTTMGTWTTYTTIMDSLRLDYPDIQFIYVTSGCSPVADDPNNVGSRDFSQAILSTYLGDVPIYDMNSILSTHLDGTPNVNANGVPYMCDEFSDDAAGVHPNTDAGEQRMARGMLVLLKQMFVQTARPGDADGDGDVDLDDFVILKTTFGRSPLTDDRADFDGDGDVDLDDFVILKTN